MTPSQTTQLTRLKAYLKERIEEWSIANPEPWIPGSDDTVWYTETDGRDFKICERTEYADDISIAHARALAPILLADKLREIDFLVMMGGRFEAQCVDYILIEDRLNEIIDAFKEVLG